LPVDSVQTYFEKIRRTVEKCGFIGSYSLVLEERSHRLGYVRGEIKLIDNSILYFREFVDLTKEKFKDDYSYQYQKEDASLIFRYDNAPHHPEIKSSPHHKHQSCDENVVGCQEPDLDSVLLEIEMVIASGSERDQS
jgi:hypothetical protein